MYSLCKRGGLWDESGRIEHYVLLSCDLIDEAMHLMVSKILQLSSERVEALPGDYVDLAAELNTSGNNSNYAQLRDMATTNEYARSGRGLTVAIQPKPRTEKPRISASRCCQ